MSASDYRHGDVYLERIPDLTHRETVTRHTEYVIAEGEATGHAHRLLAPTISVWNKAAQRYIHVPEGGVLTHEEHGAYDVAPGTYAVHIQRTWDYLAEMARQVAD